MEMRMSCDILSVDMYILAFFLFFFIDPPPTEIYTLSLHDALPIWIGASVGLALGIAVAIGVHTAWPAVPATTSTDRKSTHLNSSHGYISYAVFCLKKKKNTLISTLLSVVDRESYNTIDLKAAHTAL